MIDQDRAYGPHRPEDAPRVVTILTNDRGRREQTVPYPRRLLLQREQLNNRANRTGDRAQ